MAVEAQRPVDAHLSEEAVENYAVGRLPKAQLAAFEEHLLQCEYCQDQLAEEDDFAEAMRSLAGLDTAPSFSPVPPSSQAPASSPDLRGGLWFWIPQMRAPLALTRWTTPPWAAAIMLAVAVSLGGITVGTGIVAWKLPLARNSAGEADAVTLTTLRGGDGDGMAQAPALRPLNLSIDLAPGGSGDSSDAVNLLPETGLYRLEMVDASGGLQWTGTAQPVSGKLIALMEKRLDAGVYWIRMYAPSGKLLREFGVHLR